MVLMGYTMTSSVREEAVVTGARHNLFPHCAPYASGIENQPFTALALLAVAEGGAVSFVESARHVVESARHVGANIIISHYRIAFEIS